MLYRVTAKKVILTSFFVDLLDIVIGILVAILTGSMVLLAELFQGASDLLSSGLLIIGLKRRKEILMWSGLSALSMLLFASSLSIYFGYQRYQNPEEIRNLTLAFCALLFNFVSNAYAFYLSVKRIEGGRGMINIFRDFKTSKLFLTKNTFVLDLMGMSAALVGLIALLIYKFTGNLKFDGIGAMGIGVVLGLLSIDLMWMTFRNKKGQIGEK